MNAVSNHSNSMSIDSHMMATTIPELSNGSSNGTLDANNDDSSNTSSACDGGNMSGTERLISGLDIIINNGSECSPCSWCRGTSPKMFTLRTASGLKTFCSETCFAQCRRSSFKKNKVCDWCKHIRHTVNYVDFQDGSQQLQFCSDKCLNQYKMNVFCRETQAHIDALHSQLNLPLRSSSNGLSPANSIRIENESLITPESWLRRSGTSEHSEPSKTIDSMRIQSSDQCKSKSSHKENEHVSGRVISTEKRMRIPHTMGNQKSSKNNHSKKITSDHVIDFSNKNQAIKRQEQRKDYEENIENSFLSHHHKGSTSNSSYNLERFTDTRSSEFHLPVPKSIFPPLFQSNFDPKTFGHFPPLYPPPPPPPSGEAGLSTNSFMNSSPFNSAGDRFSASDVPLFRHHSLLPPPFLPLRSPLPNMMQSSIADINPMINSSLPPRNSFGLQAQPINGKNSNKSLVTVEKNSIPKCFPLMPIMLPFPLPLPLPIPFPIPFNRSTTPNHFHHQATQTSYDDPEESLKQKSSKKIDPELKAQVNSLMNRLIHQNVSFSRKPLTKNTNENDGQAKVPIKTDRVEQSDGKRKHEDATQRHPQQSENFENNNEFVPNSQSIFSREINESQSNKRIKKDLTVA